MALAGEWIKMRVGLWDDPRVAVMAAKMGQPEATVIGCLFRLWTLGDQHTEDGTLLGMTPDILDRKTGVDGFSEAAVSVGWLEEFEGGLRIPRFDEHNGQSAKRRSQHAKSTSKRRSQSGCAPAKRTTGAPEEEQDKRKNQNKKKGAAADPADLQAVVNAWNKLASDVGLPTVRTLTDKRKAALSARLADPDWRANWNAGIQAIRGSPFCCGAKGWKADFDWFVAPDSLTKILEGKYSDAKPTTQRTGPGQVYSGGTDHSAGGSTF